MKALYLIALCLVLNLGTAYGLDIHQFGVLDVGGIARFVIDSPRGSDAYVSLMQTQDQLALAVTSLRAVGYDNPNGRHAPLITVDQLNTVPVVQFNGKNLLYATKSAASFNGMTQLELAQYWARQLQKVSEKLPYITADHLRIYSADAMLYLAKTQPSGIPVQVAGRVVFTLTGLPNRLLPSVHRADLVYERLLTEVNFALADAHYDVKKIQAKKIGSQYGVFAGSRVIVMIAPEDVQYHHTSAGVLAETWAKNLRAAVQPLVAVAPVRGNTESDSVDIDVALDLKFHILSSADQPSA